MRKLCFGSLILAMLSAIAIYVFRTAPSFSAPDTVAPLGEGSVGAPETIADNELHRPAIPDFSGIWCLMPEEPGNRNEILISDDGAAFGDRERGYGMSSTFRLNPASRLGQAMLNARYAFEVSGDKIAQVRTTGKARYTESLFEVVAVQGDTVQLQDTKSSTRATLTRSADDTIRLELHALEGRRIQTYEMAAAEGT